MESTEQKLVINVGDVLDLCFEKYGHIDPYIVEKIGHRSQGEYSPNNSFYLVLRKMEEKDCKNVVIKEQKNDDRIYHIVSNKLQTEQVK